MPSRDFVAFDPLTILIYYFRESSRGAKNFAKSGGFWLGCGRQPALCRWRDVEYLVVGGFATVPYGAPTTTGDLGILPCADEENVVRLAGVLATLRAGKLLASM